MLGSWFLNLFFEEKELGLLREMASSRTEAGNMQDEPGTFHNARIYEGMSKGYRIQLRKLPMAKNGKILVTK